MDIPEWGRIELALKGAQFQNVWMYILKELYESVASCRAGSSMPKFWDEGLAFYSGSAVGPTASNIGYMQHSLNQKRCGSFSTCIGNGVTEPTALANVEALRSFNDGLLAVRNGDCDGILLELLAIRKQMQIGLIQGMMLYAYRSDARVAFANKPKAMGEAWAFAAGVIPMMYAASPAASRVIKSNMEYKTGIDQIVTDGYEVVFEAIYEVLPLMCITCEEIGGNAFVTSVGSKPACITNDEVVAAGCSSVGLVSVVFEESEGLTTGMMIGLLIAGVAVLGLGGVGIHTVGKLEGRQEGMMQQKKGVHGGEIAMV
jgi:hypothetical protein